ncbi:MAG: pilus assembly protein CpaC, partial [Myxococcales bacterium]|nr:pilus assembly protein CpaC [Myxococcales bacterium]
TRGVVDVRVTSDQKQIIVVAQAPGTTTLLVIMRDGARIEYNITVSHIRPRRNIRLDVYVIQIERRRGLQLGILWPGSIVGTTTFNATVDQSHTYTGTLNLVSTILPTIDLVRTKGWGKLLDQASVVAANGQEGNYNSGGEVYFRVVGGFAATLQKVEFGTMVNARLSYDDVSGRIEGHIKTDVSKITATSPDGVPTLSRVLVDTEVNLELGQSIALAGLFSDDENYQLTGLPLLSEIPIIGYFFGSHGSRERHIENVIFIVPTLVGAVGIDQRDRVSEAFRLFRQYSGDEGSDETDRDLGKLNKDAVVKVAPGKRDPIFDDAAAKPTPRSTSRALKGKE